MYFLFPFHNIYFPLDSCIVLTFPLMFRRMIGQRIKRVDRLREGRQATGRLIGSGFRSSTVVHCGYCGLVERKNKSRLEKYQRRCCQASWCDWRSYVGFLFLHKLAGREDLPIEFQIIFSQELPCLELSPGEEYRLDIPVDIFQISGKLMEGQSAELEMLFCNWHGTGCFHGVLETTESVLLWKNFFFPAWSCWPASRLLEADSTFGRRARRWNVPLFWHPNLSRRASLFRILPWSLPIKAGKKCACWTASILQNVWNRISFWRYGMEKPEKWLITGRVTVLNAV